MGTINTMNKALFLWASAYMAFDLMKGTDAFPWMDCSGSVGGITYNPSTGQVCNGNWGYSQYYVMAKAAPGSTDEDPGQFVPFPSDTDAVGDSSLSVALTAKDLVILALAVVNGVMMIIVCFVCAKSQGTRAFRAKKYQPVVMGTETEMDELQV